MALQSRVFRGLVKEAEEDMNKFFAIHPGIRVHHMAQSESGEGHISITILFEIPDYPPEGEL
ncbi:hypothetical protein MK489_08335 [Myxococcota bacterium]|nr:hypothetical protein [Myxococcota bacterium]